MSTHAEGSERGWTALLGAVLARWGEDLPLGIPLAPPSTSGLDDASRRFVDQLAGVPRERRAEVLAALERRSNTLPFDRIDGSWIAACLPDDPLLGSWCLDLLPAGVRRRAAAALAGEMTERWFAEDLPDPPAWLALWWRRELARHLDYPLPMPWALQPSQPLSYFFAVEEDPARSVLPVAGLAPLAAALRAFDERQVVSLVFRVTPRLRPALALRSRRGNLPSATAWKEVVSEILSAGPETWYDDAPDLPLLLAIEDIGAQAAALGRHDDAVRLAYRLPAALGSRLLERLERGPERLAHPDPAGWHRELAADLEQAVLRRWIQPPRWHQENWI